MTALSIVDVHLLVRSDNKILLQLRQNTGYGDGNYHFPAGHLEESETISQAACREAHEELGITIAPADLTLTYLLHQYSRQSRIGLFFETTRWTGVPSVLEPDKCKALDWFDSFYLPPNMVPYARYVLEEIANGHTLGVYGWP